MLTSHTTTTAAPTTTADRQSRNRSLPAIRRRFEKWELEHLRTHAAELADKVERLSSNLAYAEEAAIGWRDDCLRMMEESLPAGGAIGMTIDGSLHVLSPAEEPADATQSPVVNTHATPTAAGFVTPALRDGELYAGIVCGKGGLPTHHLILLPSSIADANWGKAKEWAATIGGELPTRLELAMLYANHKDAFDAAWHWSGEQHAADSDYAWGQLFDDGYQYNDHKSYEGRARAVRRLAI